MNGTAENPYSKPYVECNCGWLDGPHDVAECPDESNSSWTPGRSLSRRLSHDDSGHCAM